MPATIAQKVYDYKMPAVKTKLVSAFRKRRNESTIADLVAATGLPKYQVEQASRVVLDEYGGHCRVTESGEILYYFPRGMHNRITGFGPRARRFLRAFLSVLGRVLAFLFKIWIVAMLVGYFVLFLAIVVAAVALSIAASASSRSSSRRRGGFGAFYLVIRLLEFFLRIFFWVNLTKAMDPSKPVKKGRPFYKSVFGFVFGDADPNAEWEVNERIRVISFIRANKGVITDEELAALTGRTAEGSRLLINSFLVEFEGEPSVTDQGSLYYFFPELLRTRREELLAADVTTVTETEYKALVPFSANKGGTNGLIFFFNAFNLAFGSYFTWAAAQHLATGTLGAPGGLDGLYQIVNVLLCQQVLGIPDPTILILAVLGLVPLSFSAVFFLLPLIRKMRLRGINETIKRENLRKRIYGSLHYHPLAVDPRTIHPSSAEEDPRNSAVFIQKTIDRLAADRRAEIEKSETGAALYNFEELKREIEDIARLRQSIDPGKYDVGKTIFDTNE